MNVKVMLVREGKGKTAIVDASSPEKVFEFLRPRAAEVWGRRGDRMEINDERLLTMDEVCKKLGGVRPMTIREWVSRRKIPFTKVGRLTRFPESRINQWIASNTHAPVEP